MSTDASRILRKPENCNFCINVDNIDNVTNLDPDFFLEGYAKVARPVVIMDGASGWPALKEFSFNFFKKLHGEVG